MASDDDFWKVINLIARFGLGFLTLFCVIAVLLAILDDCSKVRDFLFWGIITLLLSGAGFFGAWKEHLFATLLYAFGMLILFATGYNFWCIRYYTHGLQGIAMVFAFIYAILLYMNGARDLHPLPITC